MAFYAAFNHLKKEEEEEKKLRLHLQSLETAQALEAVLSQSLD